MEPRRRPVVGGPGEERAHVAVGRVLKEAGHHCQGRGTPGGLNGVLYDGAGVVQEPEEGGWVIRHGGRRSWRVIAGARSR